MLYRWYHTTYLAPQPESVAGTKVGRKGLGQFRDRRMTRGVPFLLSPSPLPLSVPPRRNLQIFHFFFLQKVDDERNNKEKRREHITLIQQRKLHYCSSFLVPDLLVFLFSKTLIIFSGSEWGLVFSVIYLKFYVFAVKLVNFLMFPLSRENTIKCLEGFS